MSSTPSGPERIDLMELDDPRDAVHQAVACLARGGVVAVPSEASMLLAASALDPNAVERLHRVKNGDADRPLSLGLRAAEEVADWVPDLSALGRKFCLRAWPGPLSLIARGAVAEGLASRLDPRVRRLVAPGSVIGLRCPGHAIPRELLELVSGPLVITSAPAEALTSPDLTMILDDRSRPAALGNTVVEIDGDRWNVVREGLVPRADVCRMVGTVVLFVCTGNTCRSPMAEAICRLLLAERIGCKPEELQDRGYIVASAGIAASRGARAASEAMEVVSQRGGTLKGHISRQVVGPMIAGADHIIAMTRDHRDALLDEFAVDEDRIHLLHPRGGDIPDPIGCDRETYRRTAEAIESHINILLDRIL